MQLEEITKELTKYDTTTAAIAELSRQYMALEIKGIDDKEGFMLVHTARMNIKSKRVAVEKRAKELRADAVRFQKDCIAVEKGILMQLQPIEDHLADEESRVEEEKARIKAEAEAKEAARIQSRVNQLFEMGCRFDGTSYIYGNLNAPHALIKVASDEQFETFRGAIQKLIDEEAAAKAAEAERLAKVAAEQERIAVEQEKERQRLAEEAKAIQAEKDRLLRESQAADQAKLKAEQDKLRAEELERVKAAAIEEGKRKAEAEAQKEAERVHQESVAKAAKEEAARVRAAKKEARRPDKDKLFLYVSQMFSIPVPELKTEEGKAVAEQMQEVFEEFHARLLVLMEVL